MNIESVIQQKWYNIVSVSDKPATSVGNWPFNTLLLRYLLSSNKRRVGDRKGKGKEKG